MAPYSVWYQGEQRFETEKELRACIRKNPHPEVVIIRDEATHRVKHWIVAIPEAGDEDVIVEDVTP